MDQEYINRIEAYFSKKMSEEEIRKFKRDLSKNAELEQIFLEYQLAMDTIDQQVEDELRGQFNSWSDTKPDVKPIRRIIPNLWKIAASLAFIACLYYLLISSDQFLNGEELAISYYELPVSPGGNMGKGEAHWSVGLQAFEQKDFEQAIAEWTLLEDPSAEQMYYLAHAYFNTNSYSESTPIFKILSSGTSTFSYAADWYLVLAYLALNDKAAFLDQITKITNDSNHPYQHAATRLKKKALKVLPKEK